jgi:hypothetical protein
MLEQLATRRGEAVMREISEAGGVLVAQNTLGKLKQATDADDTAVTMQLELKVAK